MSETWYRELFFIPVADFLRNSAFSEIKISKEILNFRNGKHSATGA